MFLCKRYCRAGGMVQVVENLPRKHEDLSSNPRTTKTKRYCHLKAEEILLLLLLLLFFLLLLLLLYFLIVWDLKSGLALASQAFYHMNHSPRTSYPF
jgi:hypothetical protein